MGCICSIVISLCTTLAYCTERVSTCAVCSMFLCLIMIGMIMLSITGATLGYQYSQTEITELKFVRELRRRAPVSLTIPPPPARRRLGEARAPDAAAPDAGAPREGYQQPPPAPPTSYWPSERKPLIVPGGQPPRPSDSKQSYFKKIIYSDLQRIFEQNITRSTWYATATPHLLRKQTNAAGHRKQLYGKAENILKKMQETNLENLLPPNIELLLKQTKNENKPKSGKAEKEKIKELPEESSEENLVDGPELEEDERI